MRHVTIENLINYMDGQPTDVEKSTLEGHLTTCAECSQLNQEFQTLTTRLRDDSSFEPAADLVPWGVSLFQPVMQPESKGTSRTIIASLVFDTFQQPLTARVRRA